MLQKIVLILLALLTQLTLHAQPNGTGFFVYNETRGAVVDAIATGDTLDLTQLYENPAYNLVFFPPQADTGKAIYSLRFTRAVCSFLGFEKSVVNMSSGSSYKFSYVDVWGYLTPEEAALQKGPEFDSLFYGKLQEGYYSLKYGYGSGYADIAYYDSVDFYLFWGAGKVRTTYQILDPITQTPVVRLTNGDTLNRYGGRNALVQVVQPGPGELNLVNVSVQYDSFLNFPDTLSYLWANPLIYGDGGRGTGDKFILPGYAGSGRYFIKNTLSQLDSGILVFLKNPVVQPVDIDTVYKVTYLDSTVLNLVEKDTVVYNFLSIDTVVWNVLLQDSVKWSIIQKDSIYWNITFMDSIQYNITYRDSLVLRIIYSDSTVYDTAILDTYTELILPTLLNTLSQIAGDAESMRELLIRIQEEGLRSKEIYLKSDQ